MSLAPPSCRPCRGACVRPRGAFPVGGLPRERLDGGFCVTGIGGGITVTGVFIVTSWLFIVTLWLLPVTLSTGFFVTLSACRRTSRACLSLASLVWADSTQASPHGPQFVVAAHSITFTLHHCGLSTPQSPRTSLSQQRGKRTLDLGDGAGVSALPERAGLRLSFVAVGSSAVREPVPLNPACINTTIMGCSLLTKS